MKPIRILLAAAAFCLAGCLTVEKAKLPGSTPGHHVMVVNYGKYLFNWIPIWCGNVNENPRFDFVMFRDDVTMDKVQHRFLLECDKLGRDVSDVTYHSAENIFISFPIWSLNIPIPYLWTTHEIQITGVVK